MVPPKPEKNWACQNVQRLAVQMACGIWKALCAQKIWVRVRTIDPPKNLPKFVDPSMSHHMFHRCFDFDKSELDSTVAPRSLPRTKLSGLAGLRARANGSFGHWKMTWNLQTNAINMAINGYNPLHLVTCLPSWCFLALSFLFASFLVIRTTNALPCLRDWCQTRAQSRISCEKSSGAEADTGIGSSKCLQPQHECDIVPHCVHARHNGNVMLIALA